MRHRWLPPCLEYPSLPPLLIPAVWLGLKIAQLKIHVFRLGSAENKNITRINFVSYLPYFLVYLTNPISSNLAHKIFKILSGSPGVFGVLRRNGKMKQIWACT